MGMCLTSTLRWLEVKDIMLNRVGRPCPVHWKFLKAKTEVSWSRKSSGPRLQPEFWNFQTALWILDLPAAITVWANFLKINFLVCTHINTYLFNWFCFSGEPWLIQLSRWEDKCGAIKGRCSDISSPCCGRRRDRNTEHRFPQWLYSAHKHFFIGPTQFLSFELIDNVSTEGDTTSSVTFSFSSIIGDRATWGLYSCEGIIILN